MIKLKLGDCLERMKEIEDKSIDMILCDLPYGTTECKWDSVIPFESLWEQYKRIIKDRGAIVLFGSQPFTSALIMSNPKMFKYCWVWDKVKASTGFHAKIMPLRNYEDIIIFCKKSATYNPQMIKSKNRIDPPRVIDNGETFGGKKVLRQYKNNGQSYPKAILKISNANQNNRFHPTQKPVALCEYLIKTYTNEKDLVLDNCMGSGTTGVACINLNRSFIGIEKEKKYFKIAKERIDRVIKLRKRMFLK